MFSWKTQKNCLFERVKKISEKQQLWADLTVGSCSKFVQEYVEKISEDFTT